MEGLNEEGSEAIDGNFEDNVMDATLVSAAQRVEQAKIAAYDTVCAFAELLPSLNTFRSYGKPSTRKSKPMQS